ncbi:inorganic phosphate transporter [Thermosphaera chiliense]|uniref:Inorganic phosphate transporter n=1 Tax=Thermosphaera chiliense TaxID=3402707 RepID=A0A7M1UTF7_9CREN|nr:inorganic phosphate transporter [Thermosphaera aggregans]QOR94977.1 inorganic phosphate transporter [Thermosphaera aggregans]
MEPIVLVIIGYCLAFFMAVNIGGNDAANPVDTAVGSGVLTVRQALALFSIGVFAGALLQGSFVIKTIGKGIVPTIPLAGAVATVLAAGSWVLIATLKGMPISTSQSIVGSVIGVGLGMVLKGELSLGDLNFSVLSNIVLSWIISPLSAILLSLSLYTVLQKRLTMLETTPGGRRAIKILMILTLLFSAYSFGANDVANATGVYLFVTSKYLGLPDAHTMLVLASMGAAGIVVGGWSIGRKVIDTVAYKITKLDYGSGVVAEASNSLTVWLFTTIPSWLIGYGMPISTTHASVSSIIGVGLAKYGRKWFQGSKSVVLKIVFSWLLTLPITIIIGAILYHIIGLLVGVI